MMKKTKKVAVSILCLLVLTGILLGAFRLHQNKVEAYALEQERQIAESYWRLHRSFGIVFGPFLANLEGATFRPLREIDLELNQFGLDVYIYVLLWLYEKETGISLSWELVIDYFSEEFEPDGSLRLYNNGNHPEIQAYVEKMNELLSQVRITHYFDMLNFLYMSYVRTNAENGFIEQDLFALSPQMLDALIQAYLDPDYVLDLTSLQRAGY